MVGGDRDLKVAPPEGDREADPPQGHWEPRCKLEAAAVLPSTSEAVDHRQPATGQGGEMQAIAGVVSRVVVIEQHGLGEVVVGELHVADLGGEDRLRTGGQGRVADRQRLVVSEVRELLPLREGVTAQGHCQHDIGLLDHLATVELDVGHMQEQRVVLRRRGVEVELLVTHEVLVLR